MAVKNFQLTLDEVMERIAALTCRHLWAEADVARSIEWYEAGFVMGIVGSCQGHRAQHRGKTPAPCICGEHDS
jgi:hypothetical protein